MEGWISLHRKFLNWEWYDDINTKSLFIHCLLKANHSNKNWRGRDINRGQFFTSLNHLSIDLGLSIKQIRNSIKKLENTGELDIQGASDGTMITVCKYDSYQDNENAKGKQKGKQGASEGQARGKQGATTNNNNNNNNDINIINYKKTLLSEINISDFPELNEEILEIAKSFQELFIINLKEAGIKNTSPEKASGKWYDDIRLMKENDGCAMNEFREIFTFLRNDKFWKKNILSTDKLRQQREKLLMAARNNTSKNNSSSEMDAFKAEIADKLDFK